MQVVVQNLRIGFPTEQGVIAAVRGVSFSIGQEKVGIVGESGSGKSLTARSILKLLPRHAQMTADRLTFNGTDVLGASETAMRRIRGREIGLVLQDPKFSLNPVMTVGDQIAETWRVHHGGNRSTARRKVLDLLAQVQIRNPERVGGDLCAPAFRRDGPARDDRDGVGSRPQAADRGRADQRAGRHRAGRRSLGSSMTSCPASAWGFS